MNAGILLMMIKFKKMLLSRFEDNNYNNVMISHTNAKKCLVTYCASNIFNLSNSIKVSMNLIERCFPIISDSDNLFELDFNSLMKILSSNDLKIDSELQVFIAADSWLCHDINKRGKYAKYL